LATSPTADEEKSDLREAVIPLDVQPKNQAEPNEFEQLQNEREEEFMAFLCAPLATMLPEDFVEYVVADLSERLKQTVCCLRLLCAHFWLSILTNTPFSEY
jgi:hypothetical protein